MQRHRRLTRPRTALDHKHAPPRGGDDPVLLGLDRGHDVTHPAVAGRRHRCDESPLALQLTGGHGGPGRARRGTARLQGGEVQDLVLHSEHLAGPGVDVPTAHQPHGVGGRGLVEGPGQGSAPVQDHLTVLSVLQPDTAHVVASSAVGDRRRAAHARPEPGEGAEASPGVLPQAGPGPFPEPPRRAVSSGAGSCPSVRRPTGPRLPPGRRPATSSARRRRPAPRATGGFR